MIQQHNETAASQDLLKLYMQEISNHTLLSPEDERKLADEIHGENPELRAVARETLICANLRLVVKIAHDFKERSLALADLIAEGNVGLIRAAEKYDPTQGAKFSSYAAWWIKQAMRRAIANRSRTIRVPIQVQRKIAEISNAENRLQSELGRIPSDAELAAATQHRTHTVAQLRQASLQLISLDAQVSGQSDDPFYEVVADSFAPAPEQYLADADTLKLLHAALKTLSPREQLVLKLRFFQNKTLSEISAAVGKTRERVRQIQKEALGKLQQQMVTEIGVA